MKKRLLSTFTALLMVCSMVMYFPQMSILASAATNAEIRSKMISILYNNSGGSVSCDFDGYTTTAGRHEGIDCCKGSGSKVYSLIAGEVIRVENSSSLSTLAIYDSAHNKTVIYLHSNIQVSNGAHVSQGQFVAYEDSRGASAAHTHVEVRDGRQQYAAKSVNDYTLENSNPYPYWGNVLFGGSNPINPGTVDSSYNKNVSCKAPSKIYTYDAYGNRESNHYVDPGDSCTGIEAYTNGYWKIDYPAGSVRRIAFMKLSEWNPFTKVGNPILPGTVDVSYNKNFSCTAPSQIHTYDAYGNRESNRWVDPGDSCIAIEAYTNGYWKIDYPAGSVRRIAYMKLSEWNPFSKVHTHSYSSTVVAATCTSKGYTLYKCSCGDSYKNNYTDLAAHKFSSWSTTKAATCAAEGQQTRKCSVCGKTETQSIAKTTTHSFGSWTTTKAATCAAEGQQTRKCSVCGKTETQSISKTTTHSFGSWSTTKAATCAAEGQQTRKCSVCGKTETQSISKTTTHSFGSWSTTKPATCAAAGEQTRKCSVCGKTETQSIAKTTTHSFGDWTTATAATCTKDGTETRKCTVCGYTESKSIKASGHKYTGKITTEPTCTTAGIMTYSCSCGDSYTEMISATGHDYETTTVAPTETSQGYDLHTCKACKHSYKDNFTDIIGHNWNAAIYTWSDDNKICTAIRVCANDSTHVETEIVSTTYSVTKQPTNVENGTGTFTATFKNTAFAKQTKNIDIPRPVPDDKYPVVTSEVSGRQFRLKWTAVKGAEKYGIALYQSGKWRVKAQFAKNVTTFTSSKMKTGSYRMVVCAKVNGEWDTSSLSKRAFTIKIA